MNKIKFFTLFVCISIAYLFSSCTNTETKLKSQGYQVFPQQKLALKCPCKLKLDTEDIKASKKKFSNYKSYVCDTRFNTTHKKYHVQFYSESKYEINEGINGVKKMLNREGHQYSERNIAESKALYYNFSPFAQGIQLFHPKFGCFIIVESSDCKKDINKLIKTIKLY